jgi:amidohydrolase
MGASELSAFRKFLHQNAELSGMEKNTADILISKLQEFHPDELITGIGGYGIAAIFNGKESGKTILFRADMDALPIAESNDFEHISMNPDVGHKCGHDGHMTILIGLADVISNMRNNLKGTVILLFQPAEEIAEGAKRVLEDSKWDKIKPDYVFALHNLPGFQSKSIIMREGIFSSASKGAIFKLRGETSHAAHPENGRSPLLAMLSLIQGLIAIPGQYTKFSNAAMITIIHAKLGEVAFGTSPGYAEVMATLRSHYNQDMDIMIEKAINLLVSLSDLYDLKTEFELTEEFPATENDISATDIVKESATALSMEIISPENPFPWSEDFGYFTEKYRGCLFGLGSGMDHPQLHNSNYDFPDEITQHGIDIFTEIIKRSQK